MIQLERTNLHPLYTEKGALLDATQRIRSCLFLSRRNVLFAEKKDTSGSVARFSRASFGFFVPLTKENFAEEIGSIQGRASATFRCNIGDSSHFYQPTMSFFSAFIRLDPAPLTLCTRRFFDGSSQRSPTRRRQKPLKLINEKTRESRN